MDADNHKILSMPDLLKNETAFQVLVTGFKFKKALMQEQFSEDYIQGTKFAKATFQGAITNVPTVNFMDGGSYPVTIAGIFTMHGVTNKIEVPATVRVVGKKISADSKFMVKLADYNINTPTLVTNEGLETVAIIIGCQYAPLKR